MQTTKPEDPNIEDAVRTLIRRISRGSRDAQASVPSRVRNRHGRQLTGSAVRLLETLPPGLRLVGLRGQFPRILNRIADAWHSPRELEALTRSLLIDERGGRQGFPIEVVTEITELREYYFAMVHPRSQAGAQRNGVRGFR